MARLRGGNGRGLPGWRVIETPGHSPGHVSLFRESDGVLIAGDAFVTTKQESLLAVMTQRQELRGPPMYFTCDWDAARESVQKLWDPDQPELSWTQFRSLADELG